MFKNLSNEVWKDIEGYPGYQVSNYGRVRSLNYNHTGQVRVLKPRTNSNGYLRVDLYKNNKHKYMFIHRLVAIAFIPNPLNLPEVNHKDENKQNNFIFINPDGTVDPERSNLEWCTVAYNNTYANKHKKIAEKLSKRVAQYTLDGTLVAEYPSANEAARQTGFNQRHICDCCNGKRKTHKGYIWKYID